ncbi:MAG: phosphopantothenoylcysteine decarboxylase [Phycisphaeraceae bacterium]
MAHLGKMLVTAGPTYEPIDPVRYLANRSTGKTGAAIAEAAADAGWAVTLLLGPTPINPPPGVKTVRFETSNELEQLLDRYFSICDVLVMAAAVADYRPAAISFEKLTRETRSMMLELEPVPDLVAACGERKRSDQLIVGFALEQDGNLVERAKDKLQRKHLSAIVANPLPTMGASDIDATLLTADGESHVPGKMEKSRFAAWLIDWIEDEM